MMTETTPTEDTEETITATTTKTGTVPMITTVIMIHEEIHAVSAEAIPKVLPDGEARVITIQECTEISPALNEAATITVREADP